MIFKGFVVLILLEVISLNSIHSTKRDLWHMNHEYKKVFEKSTSLHDRHQYVRGGHRRKRSLSTIIALLWPQVVGPVEEGNIQEKSFDDIPKTLLEYRLERIRNKALEEEKKRLSVRDYMKSLTDAQDQIYGYPTYRAPGPYYKLP